MPVVNRHCHVKFTPQQMFDLVNDIEAYPDFLPWCSASEVHSRNEDEIQASLTLSRSGFEKSFTTCNRLQKGKMIEVRLVNGPFSLLEGFWRFEKTEDGGCNVILDMEFEFSNKFIAMPFSPVFSQIVSTLVDSFSERAEQVYGT